MTRVSMRRIRLISLVLDSLCLITIEICVSHLITAELHSLFTLYIPFGAFIVGYFTSYKKETELENMETQVIWGALFSMAYVAFSILATAYGLYAVYIDRSFMETLYPILSAAGGVGYEFRRLIGSGVKLRGPG